MAPETAGLPASVSDAQERIKALEAECVHNRSLIAYAEAKAAKAEERRDAAQERIKALEAEVAVARIQAQAGNGLAETWREAALDLVKERDAARARADQAEAALRDVVAISKSGADTISFLIELNALAKRCASLLQHQGSGR